jgi:Ca2+-binding RTX toxin-like protein
MTASGWRQRYGFLDNGGTFSTIAVPGAAWNVALGINDFGQIVGYYVDSTGGHGFVDTGGVFSTIDVPGVIGTVADAINDSGQILGWSSDGYSTHGFLANENGGSPPTITSNGGGDSASVSVPENSTAVTTVTAQDPDGQALTFSIDGGDDASKFTIGSTTGKLAFLSAPDFEVPTDTSLDGFNTYHVNVKVSDAASGSDTQAITVAVTNVLGETWVGGNGGHTHTGTGEEDNLTGGNGNDIIDGGGGNDIIKVGNGADTLIGGAGDDTLTGGNGPDLFVFAAGFGKDIIADFKPMVDVIQFDSAVFPNFAAVQSHIADNGTGSAVITASGSDTITLQGVSLAQLGAPDFKFV